MFANSSMSLQPNDISIFLYDDMLFKMYDHQYANFIVRLWDVIHIHIVIVLRTGMVATSTSTIGLRL